MDRSGELVRKDSAEVGKERFRKGFVLLLTLAYTIAFVALVFGFIQPILLAAVFTGVLYPLYRKLVRTFRGRKTLASLSTLVIAVLAVVIPLTILLGLVAQQAVAVSEQVTPWVQQHLAQQSDAHALPSWVPFSARLEPYHEQISAKLAEIAGSLGGYLASSLARVSEGTAVFFLDLFIMLYAMFFFLISGPTLIRTIMGYAPLTEADKEKMLKVGLSVSRATVKGTLVIGIIQGALGGIGFAVVGIDAAVFWAAVMAVLSVLPGIGATLVWAPAVIYLLVSGQTVAGIGLLIWSAGVVGTIDNVLRPRLVGRDTKMPDLLILLSTLGGLGLFGASGLVLGPILAALFLAVLAIYSRIFADWLNLDSSVDESSVH